MQSDFTLEFREDHVHAELGPNFVVDSETQDEFWNHVRAVCEKHDSRRVLVEGFVPAGERDAHEVVDAGQRTAVVPKLWIAFRLEDFQPTSNSELFVAIAATKGIRVKFFSKTERALNWLRLNAPA